MKSHLQPKWISMIKMRLLFKNGLAIVVGLMLSAPLVRAANLLTNPGFEADPQGSTTNIFGWNSYSGSSGNVWSETSAAIAHGGTNYLKAYQAFNGVINYNGVYQDNLSGPGAVYAADGWVYTSASDTLAGQNAAWIEVTFRDASANVLALYRSALITTNAIATGTFPKSAWIDLPITNQYNPNTYIVTNYTSALVAPAGTSFVRYQITFQGDALYSAGSVYFDDLTLTQTSGGPQGNWNIVWSDEFNGSSIATTNWTFDIGNNDGWGNNEAEYYTSLPRNVYVSNGFLNIVALNQSNYDGSGCNYTSARIKSEGLFTALYGRFAFRVKLPAGQGLWPALWMMPEDSVYGGWAASGEIDVMENIGSIPTNVFGTLHYGGPWPDDVQSSGPSYNFLPGTSVTNFNIYVLEWTTNAFNWYVNGWLYESQVGNWWSTSTTNYSSFNPYPAPFNEPFYLIMNLAVGGTLGGTIDNSIFPCDMQVDYVRLYNLTAPLQLTSSLSGGTLLLTWPSNIVCHLESTTNLSVASAWNNVAGAVTPFFVTPPSTAVFYRLASP
jgi:beta-glucanase (GH16 family)